MDLSPAPLTFRFSRPGEGKTQFRGQPKYRPLGFTLIELVVTLILVGILAAAVMPRMLDRQTIDAQVFHDQVAALLRYAQKAAIAQRHDVCVAFTGNSATLSVRMASGDGDGSANATGCNGAALAGADGSSPAGVVARSAGTGFSATPGGFAFHARGDTTLAANLSIGITGASAITVETATGYVH